MRSGSPSFDAALAQPNKEIQLALRIDIDGGLWLTSNTVAGLSAGPGETLIDGVIEGVSSLSQKLNADQGRAEIGSLSFSVVDVNSQITAALKAALDNGHGLKGKTVQLYRGDASIDWADFRLEQTQKIHKQVKYGDGQYDFACADIQREMRRDIFDPAKTFLAAEFSAAATTLTVNSTADFEACPHTASFTDAPGATVYYVKIKYSNGYEVIRATGKTATTFTGCVRGLFGSTARTHAMPEESGSDEGIEIEEFVYLEMPGPVAAYALLTGQIIGGGALPARWHLGIDPAFVDVTEFQTVGSDWFDPSNHNKGVVVRFDGPVKQDGKKFIESEINLLLGAFMPVKSDGALGFRRMARVLVGSSASAVLDESVIVKYSDLTHDMDAIRNILDISWARIQRPEEKKPVFLRRNLITDAVSVGLYGAAKPYSLSFAGLHNARHTISTLSNRFDALRDRYTHPPLTLSLDLLPSCASLEVGDVVRVTLPQLRDFTTGGTLDRSMEIVRSQVNQLTGLVQVQLFGSSGEATPIADSIGGSSELPDGWYNSAGTNLSGLLSLSGGILQADATLTGGTTTRTIFYLLSDLTIPAGRVLTCTGNVELRIRGHLQIEGEIKSSGGNSAGVRGFIGTSRGGAGKITATNYNGSISLDNSRTTIVGKNSTLPPLDLVNDAGVLGGIPADMRGSGGGHGGKAQRWNRIDSAWELQAVGGVGGVGGGSIVFISRGAAFGLSGKVKTNGGNGAIGGSGDGGGILIGYAGSGGGGAPGCALFVIDGIGVTVPIIASAIEAKHGLSPINGGRSYTVGTNGDDMKSGAARVIYVPKSRTPYPNYEQEDLTSAAVAAAQAAAVAAQSDATAALSSLSDISADYKLTPNEKITLAREKADVDAEKSGIETQATALGISTEKTNYSSAYSALGSYLAGLTPAVTDTTTTTAIIRSAFDGKWSDYYAQRQILLNKIAEVAASKAGSGINLMHPNYSHFGGLSLSPIGTVSGCTVTRGIAASVIFYGTHALYVAMTTSSTAFLFFAATSLDYNLRLPAGKYIVSAVMRHQGSNAGSAVVTFNLRRKSNSSYIQCFQTSGLSSTRIRYSGVADLTGDGFGESYNLSAWFLAGTIASGDYQYIDAIMIEPMVGNDSTPSPYVPPTAAAGINGVQSNDSGQLYDQRGLPQINTAGGGTAIGTGSPVSAADVGSTATISIAAHSRQYGFGAVSLNAGSIAGLSFTTKYHVYYDDADYNGGAVTYGASTSVNTACTGNARVYLGYITTPANGGGGTVTPPEQCVAVDQWLTGSLLAENCIAGDFIDTWVDGTHTARAPITRAIRKNQEPCVELVTESGARVVVSITSPVETFDHKTLEAQDTLGELVGVLHGNTSEITPEKVVEINFAGERDVMRISIGDISYAAGTDSAHRVITHNTFNKP